VLGRIPKRIENFRGKYSFLSNFYASNVKIHGINYTSAEHAYQAQKSLDKQVQLLISGLKYPGQAKKYGSTITLRPDWGIIRIEIMAYIILNKFYQNTYIGALLLNTCPSTLVEGNWWGDTFWGIDMKSGSGENWLGEILMKVRHDLPMVRNNPDVIENQYGKIGRGYRDEWKKRVI